MDHDAIMTKGFNAGYKMQKHSPATAVALASAFKNPSHPYAEGFMKGSIECIQEHKQDVQQFLRQIAEEK